MPNLKDLITSDPEVFINTITARNDWQTQEFAAELDEIDPLKDVREQFDIRELIPFAGHSLGPPFKPTAEQIQRILELQATQLHAGHFPSTHSKGGNWFDCDIDEDAIAAAQPILGFGKYNEFLYIPKGCSDNLGNLLDSFYYPDWNTGQTGICYLGKEFFADQAVIQSLLEKRLQQARSLKIFNADKPEPSRDSLAYEIPTDQQKLYNEDDIIAFVRAHAKKIKILQLSEIAFNTGQRLDLSYILGKLRGVIKENQIIVGLDLAHSVGNRPINLKALDVDYAVGCAYKHLCGSAGSGFGIYVNANTDLKKYPPIQGWKAARSDKVFETIDKYDPDIMLTTGAWAFRCSNPSPIALAATQCYMKTMNAVGWDKLFAKSECLTRYLRLQLQNQLGNKIEFITPEDPRCRGAMLVFRIKELASDSAEDKGFIKQIEAALKSPNELGQYEIDTRAPNFRITAHYGYTRFVDIFKMVQSLKQIVEQVLKEKALKQPIIVEEKQRREQTVLASSSSRHLVFASAAVADNFVPKGNSSNTISIVDPLSRTTKP